MTEDKLKSLWQSTSGDLPEDLPAAAHTPGALETLKRNLLINLCFAYMISAGYILLLWWVDQPIVRSCIAITLLFNVWIMRDGHKLYAAIHPEVNGQNDLLTELKRHHTAINRWIKSQQQVALFIYPIALTGGFILGGMLGSGQDPAVFLFQKPVLIAYGIALVVCVPLCYWWAKWMSHHAFGKHLHRLKDYIDQLETLHT